MPGVAYLHVQRPGVLAHDDPRLTEIWVRSQPAPQPTSRHGERRQHAADRERRRVRPQRFVRGVKVAAQQCALDATQQESVTADLQPGCRLTQL
jgi:hypothetical protein